MRAAGLALAAGLAASTASAADGPEDLLRAYPGYIARIEGGSLVWRDGTRMPVTDGVSAKSFEQKLDRPDIDDMFVTPYRTGPPQGPPGVNEDPGRVRYEPLFVRMYGDCFKGDVRPRLRPVRWVGGERVEFTSVNGADRALAAVARELEGLPAPMRRYLTPTAGTYNCRAIAGTSRRSMHGYGAAIDINTRLADNWQWARPTGGRLAWRNRIPYEIARIFERHGFIWGAKWYHFDSMHFEYRPELLGQPPKARAVGAQVDAPGAQHFSPSS